MQIQIQDLSMTYPSGKQALQRLDLDLTSPSLVGLLGPNGAGKSTLMKLLVAALLPTSGSILVDGQPLAKGERQLKARLGYLPQDFGLFDELTVTQFLDYMAALKGLREAKAAIQRAIRAVNLEEKARAKIRTLSGGQRQRVGIAQALLGEPSFLIFDEPTAGLDPAGRENLMANIRDYHRNKKRTIILVSHSMDEIARNVDRILVLKSAHVLMSGTPAEVFARAEELLSAGLDVPQVTRIAMRLREQGLAIDPAVYTVEALERELLALRRGETGC